MPWYKAALGFFFVQLVGAARLGRVRFKTRCHRATQCAQKTDLGCPRPMLPPTPGPGTAKQQRPSCRSRSRSQPSAGEGGVSGAHPPRICTGQWSVRDTGGGGGCGPTPGPRPLAARGAPAQHRGVYKARQDKKEVRLDPACNLFCKCLNSCPSRVA
jgi:hypothetical protein